MDEKGNYLTVLLNDNENLKNLLTAYLNTLVAMKAVYEKTGGETTEQYQSRLMQTVKPEERQILINITTGFRAYATRIKISINTIKGNLPTPTLAQLEEDYEEIKSKPAPNYDVCERFVQNVNDLLMKNLNVEQIVRNSK